MAIGVIFEGAGVSQEQYQQVLNEVAGGNTPAPGLLYHAAGVGEDGLLVFEVWESQEVLQQFFEEQLGQALQRPTSTSNRSSSRSSIPCRPNPQHS
jgi:hypothetical protein